MSLSCQRVEAVDGGWDGPSDGEGKTGKSCDADSSWNPRILMSFGTSVANNPGKESTPLPYISCCCPVAAPWPGSRMPKKRHWDRKLHSFNPTFLPLTFFSLCFFICKMVIHNSQGWGKGGAQREVSVNAWEPEWVIWVHEGVNSIPSEQCPPCTTVLSFCQISWILFTSVNLVTPLTWST